MVWRYSTCVANSTNLRMLCWCFGWLFKDTHVTDFFLSLSVLLAHEKGYCWNLIQKAAKKRHTIFILFCFFISMSFLFEICVYMSRIAWVQHEDIHCTVSGFALFKIQCWSKTCLGSHKKVHCCIWRKIFFFFSHPISALDTLSKDDIGEFDIAGLSVVKTLAERELADWMGSFAERASLTIVLDQGVTKPGGRRPT